MLAGYHGKRIDTACLTKKRNTNELPNLFLPPTFQHTTTTDVSRDCIQRDIDDDKEDNVDDESGACQRRGPDDASHKRSKRPRQTRPRQPQAEWQISRVAPAEATASRTADIARLELLLDWICTDYVCLPRKCPALPKRTSPTTP
jgi:hypothetical protein